MEKTFVKKHIYKIYAFVLIMLCALTCLAACGDNEFSLSKCRQAYIKNGYTVVSLEKALNDTAHYNKITNATDGSGKTKEQLQEEFKQGKENYLMLSGDLKKLYDNVYDNNNQKKANKDIYIYTSNGFIAYKISQQTVQQMVIVAYKSSTLIEGFENNIYHNFYSNISKDVVKNTYNFSEKK